MVAVSQYSQIPVPVLLYTSCHILSVNTQCQTFFQIKRIKHSETKLTLHQHFTFWAVLEVKPSPPQTYIYVNKYQHKRYFNYCSINTVFRSNMCFHKKLTTFRLICTSDLPASYRSTINLALVFISTAF